MLKTNSKQVRETIRAYIVENSDDVREFIDGGAHYASDFEAVAVTILDTFRAGVAPYEIKRDGVQGAFIAWASGLVFNLFDYYADYTIDVRGVVDYVGDMLQQTASERAKYSASRAAWLLTYLIYSECEKATRKYCERAGVSYYGRYY